MFSRPFKRTPESPVESAPPVPQTQPLPIEALVETPLNIEETPKPQMETSAHPLETTPPEAEPLLPNSEVRVVKPLFVGAFLNGELEIVEVLEHGPINFYRANAGGWGENEWKWVWERPTSTTEPVQSPADSFFASATRFVADDREYAVYEWDEPEPFADWRSLPNDDTFLELITPLARSLESLENAGLKATIEPDSLYFQDGTLSYFGFCDTATANAPQALASLASLSSTLAKAHLAPRATLRLDDLWASLPFSIELKEWAHQLETGIFPSVADAVQALQRFAVPLQTHVHVQTDVRVDRDHNEDGVLSLSLQRASQDGSVSLELLAVADGMGGHEAGEVASQTALDTLQCALLKRQSRDWNDNFEVLTQGRELIEAVNTAVVAQNEAPPFASMRNKPGTTLVFALRIGRRLLVGNVGDSRLYRWSAARGLEHLTKDHSYVQNLLDAGKIAPDEAWGHPDSSIITSHIGMARGLLLDVSLRLISRGERIVVVSDGVVDTLRDPEIEEVIANATDAPSLCSRLVDAANGAGGIDNISVAALFCE